MDANLILKASGAVTSNTNHSSVDFGGSDLQPLTYLAVVTAVSGTSPTLDLTIEESDDNSNWHTFLSFRQISAVGLYAVTGKSDAQYRRGVSTVGGTSPSFTFALYPVPGGRYKEF